MTKRIVVLCIASMLLFGCKGKEKKPEDLGPDASAAGAQDPNIQSKDMTFDAQGSDSGSIAGLYTITFDYDKSSLSEEARSLAQKNADWMKQHENTAVQIEGHCDRHGSIEYNLALGERRAKTVKSYMRNLGISESRLATISYGKEKPLDHSESDAADRKNRRANFVVSGK
jgi:peptidoglycan-associated lipoprotein